MAVLLGIPPRIPIADVLLVPQRPVVNAVFEMINRPGYVFVEGSLLLGGERRPVDGVDAAVVIVEGAGLWDAHVRQLSAMSGVHLIAVEKLNLNIHAVIDE